MLKNKKIISLSFREISSRFSSGFTMIELIIVISVMAGLATIFMNTYPASQGRARDTQRRSDLKQYQIALEAFASRSNGLYPLSAVLMKPHDLCSAGGDLENYDNCPDDPKDGAATLCSSGQCIYNYQTDAAGAAQYTLWARLERPADDITNIFFVVCSNGQSGDGTAPAGGGNCPL